MEAFHFLLMQTFRENAATILISDIIPTVEEISADKRETALRTMMTLALES